MRIRFVEAITKLAKKNKDVVLITGDLGFSVFEDFIQEMPDQFLNAGIAEQNMTGLAAGMANEGKIPFVYSIVPFVTMRNFEQIRNDICYQNMNVKIVGVGAGFSYSIYGYTHNALEDLAILRTLPNMHIFSPADPMEVKLAVKDAMKIKGPVYIRLAKAGEPLVHSQEPKKSCSSFIIKDGTDITLIATGTMVFYCLEIAKFLEEKGISTRVISMYKIKPFDSRDILSSAKKTKAVFTIEEHTIIGGLGSAVAEVIAENNLNVIFKRFGSPDFIAKSIGTQNYMRKISGLSVDTLTKKIVEILNNNK